MMGYGGQPSNLRDLLHDLQGPVKASSTRPTTARESPSRMPPPPLTPLTPAEFQPLSLEQYEREFAQNKQMPQNKRRPYKPRESPTKPMLPYKSTLSRDVSKGDEKKRRKLHCLQVYKDRQELRSGKGNHKVRQSTVPRPSRILPNSITRDRLDSTGSKDWMARFDLRAMQTASQSQSQPTQPAQQPPSASMTSDIYDSDDAMNRSPHLVPQMINYDVRQESLPFVSREDEFSKGTPDRSRKTHHTETPNATRYGDGVLMRFLGPDQPEIALHSHEHPLD